MSNLPVLISTKIEIPRPSTQFIGRATRSTIINRSLNVTIPKNFKNTSTTISNDYLQMSKIEKNSMENKIDDLLRGVSISSVEFKTLNSLIICLKERKRKYIQNSDYPNSQKVEELIFKLNSMIVQNNNEKIQKDEIINLENQLFKANNLIKIIKEKWEQKILTFNNEQSKAAKQLENEQKHQLIEFDSNISTNLPSKYSKLSSNLLDLREKERQLVLSKRYEEATKLKKDIDKIEIEEIENQKNNYFKNISKQRNKLIEDQKNIIDCFILRWSRHAEKLKKDMENEILIQQKIIDNIQNNLLKFKKLKFFLINIIKNIFFFFLFFFFLLSSNKKKM